MMMRAASAVVVLLALPLSSALRPAAASRRAALGAFSGALVAAPVLVARADDDAPPPAAPPKIDIGKALYSESGFNSSGKATKATTKGIGEAFGDAIGITDKKLEMPEFLTDKPFKKMSCTPSAWRQCPPS